MARLLGYCSPGLREEEPPPAVEEMRRVARSSQPSTPLGRRSRTAATLAVWYLAKINFDTPYFS